MAWITSLGENDIKTFISVILIDLTEHLNWSEVAEEIAKFLRPM